MAVRVLPLRSHPVCRDEARALLELVATCVLVYQRQLSVDMLMDRFGNSNAAWLSQIVQPHGNVHAVPNDVIPRNQHVPQIDSNAVSYRVIFLLPGIALFHGLLEIDGKRDRIVDTSELGEEARRTQSDETAARAFQQRFHDLDAAILDLRREPGRILPVGQVTHVRR